MGGACRQDATPLKIEQYNGVALSGLESLVRG